MLAYHRSDSLDAPSSGYLTHERKEARMYIGIGTLLLVLLIVLLIVFVF
jgi:hypothetical protein